MSRNQRLVIAVLATGVVLVMGCLGCLLASLPGVLAPWAAPSGRVYAPTLTSSPTPTRGPSTTDKDYADCFLAFGEDLVGLMNDIGFACEVGAQDPLAFCAYWSGGGYTARAQRMVSMHNGCPRPSSDCMVEAERWMSQALEEFVSGTSSADAWCQHGNLSDLTLLRASAEHAVRGQRYVEQANDAVQRCPW